MKYAVIGREGRYHFGGTSVPTFETWQEHATLYQLTYPKREYQSAVPTPNFRRANPVDSAEAIDLANELEAKVKSYAGISCTKRQLVLWEDDGQHCWLIHVPSSTSGVESDSRRISAKEFFQTYPEGGEALHLGTAFPTASRETFLAMCIRRMAPCSVMVSG